MRWERLTYPMEIATKQVVCPRCQRYVMEYFNNPEGVSKYICPFDLCHFNFPKDRLSDMINRTRYEPGPLHMALPQYLKDLMSG